MSQQPFDLSSVPRDSRRVPIATSVMLKFDRFDGFISEYSSNISPTGMFITAKSPVPPGSVLDFEFRLGDGFEIIQGKGEVVWTRLVAEGPHRPTGIGIRFLELSEGSKELIYRIVDQYIQDGGVPFDVSLRPPDPVPAQAFTEPNAPFPDLPDSGSLPPVDSSAWLPPLSDDGLDLLGSPAGSRSDLDDDFPPFMAPMPPMDEPETMRPSLSFSALSARSASAPARPKRAILPFVLLGLLLALAVAGYLFRDSLMSMAGFGGNDPNAPDESEVAAQAAPAEPRAAEVVEEEPAGPLPEVVQRKSPEPAAPLAPLAPIAPAAAETPPPAPAGPSLTVLERITFEQAGGGTDIILWGNGAIRPEVYDQSRIGNPPRELVRLVGISRPCPSTKVAVGTGEVRQIRVGYHEKSGGNELHIVIDLADPAVRITGIEARDNHLRIRLRKP